MNEDAGCNNPCGGEPMMCGNCPEIRSSETPPDYDYDAYDDGPDLIICLDCEAKFGEPLVEEYESGNVWTCPFCGSDDLDY